MSVPATLATSSGGESPVLLGAFLIGGVVAIWCGVAWAFDIKGISTRRSERARAKSADVWAGSGRVDTAPTTFFGSLGYLRFLGGAMALAGVLLLLVTYALWQLGR
ncbi:hypothetical protein ABT127_33480 [Streptomyces sp. NPDC001904]|uniref:hypothetical protein n=1 Tax=Streptomyces sp. NPDC001904 TaxID=3154531 RepID=UPI00332BCCFA